MRIPFWIWIVIGLSVLSWIIPDGFPGEEFLLPAIAVGGLLIRRLMMKNFYQQQYQQYQKQSGQSGSTGASGSSGASGSAGSAGSFYSRFRNWSGAGFQQTQAPFGKDPYLVLGLQKNASMDEIKKAYRDKLKKFHPDVIENLKLGPEYREMFEEKTREIQKAYESLGGK
jgi:DnaJ-domain-containing protein 1